ncbi:MAG: 1-(5-phosphoribosyl)-5-[(5-phosphoribosylamino)methylideneamino] imidazole-4-carboxamide isomerase [Steroidobacteraceae bacterium]
MLLIPSIDLRGGLCVRLLQGDFAAETRYELSAHELLLRYRTLGASWLHVVDLDGARAGTPGNLGLIHALASRHALRLQVGGGLRSAAQISDLLAHGVARAVIGSAAIEQVDEVRGWLREFGPERICLAFDVCMDAQGVPRVRTRGWQRQSALSLWDALAPFMDSGLRHVLCTDIERDGALEGPNLELYVEALRRHAQLQWQASGGVASGADLSALSACGVPAAISGKALLEERISIAELKAFLPNA